MFLKIILGAAVLLGGLAIVINMQPDEFNVSRSALMNAPAEKVFAQINDHHNWEHWSPWGKLDPNMKSTITGPASGLGSVYSWSGNSQVGEGISTIVDSRADEFVKMKLEFLKPFKGTSDVEFTLKPEGASTLVTWNMTGKSNFIAKAMGLFMDCGKMMDAQFDQGLAALKAIVEKS